MFTFQYASTLLLSSLSFRGVETNPRTTTHILYVCIVMLINQIIVAYLFGELANQMSVINKQSDDFQERIDNSYTIMEYLTIETKLRHKVLIYINKTNMTREQQEDIKQFTSSLRKGLQFSVKLKINTRTIVQEYAIQKTLLDWMDQEKLEAQKQADSFNNSSMLIQESMINATKQLKKSDKFVSELFDFDVYLVCRNKLQKTCLFHRV